MDIQRINSVLSRAIVGLQGAELEAMAEAMAVGRTSYQVPSPAGKMAGSYKVPTPKAMGLSSGVLSLDEFCSMIERGVASVVRGKYFICGPGRLVGDRVAILDFIDAPPSTKRDHVDLWNAKVQLRLWVTGFDEDGISLPKVRVEKGVLRGVKVRARSGPPDKIVKYIIGIVKKTAPLMKGMSEAMASGVTSYDVPRPGMMGGYVPPVPGQLGPKPKQIRRPRLRKKWAKMPIEIAFGPKGLNVKTVEAWVKGVWAVHKNPRGPGWHLTHAPTGMAAYPNIDSEKSGKAIIDEFLERRPLALGMGRHKGPDDAREVAAEFRSKYVDVLKDVVKELRDPAFLEKFPPGIGKKFRGADPGRAIHGPDDTFYSRTMVY